MSSNLFSLDNGFPTFTGKESAQQQIASIHNYLFLVRESLQYSLANLGRSNFNPKELQEMSDEQKTMMEQLLEQVYSQMQQLAGQLGGLASTVTGQGRAIGEFSDQMTAAHESLEKLGQVLQVAEDGSAKLGSEGKRLDLTGEIYINGVLYGQGGTA